MLVYSHDQDKPSHSRYLNRFSPIFRGRARVKAPVNLSSAERRDPALHCSPNEVLPAIHRDIANVTGKFKSNECTGKFYSSTLQRVYLASLAYLVGRINQCLSQW